MSCSSRTFVLFSLGEMNEVLRQNVSQELGFSSAVDVEGTQYFK